MLDTNRSLDPLIASCLMSYSKSHCVGIEEEEEDDDDDDDE